MVEHLDGMIILLRARRFTHNVLAESWDLSCLRRRFHRCPPYVHRVQFGTSVDSAITLFKRGSKARAVKTTGEDEESGAVDEKLPEKLASPTSPTSEKVCRSPHDRHLLLEGRYLHCAYPREGGPHVAFQCLWLRRSRKTHRAHG